MPIVQVIDLLRCPHCSGSMAMADEDAGVRCDHGHHFDLAKQGYLNLSTAPQPANADTAAMVAARDRFLAAGCFEPITDAACRVADLPVGSRILDAGAGTGRLLAALIGSAGASTPEGGRSTGRPAAERSPESPALSAGTRGIALDISTAAARRSARAHQRIGAVVADVWQALPVADGAVDLLVSNFAPRNPPEFARVLAVGGRLLTISPTADHLAELRRRYGLLEIQPDKSGRLARSLEDRFEPADVERIEFQAQWPPHVVADAIAMGPNAFHPDPERAEPRASDVTVSVELRIWHRA